MVRKRTPLLPPSRAAAKQSKSEGRSPAFTETGDADNNHDKDEDDEDKEDYQPLAKRTRTAAAAEAILSGKSAAPSGALHWSYLLQPHRRSHPCATYSAIQLCYLRCQGLWEVAAPCRGSLSRKSSLRIPQLGEC